MEIKSEDQRFYVGDAASPDAEVTFVPTGSDTIIIEHTFTKPEMRGQGIAKQLVEHVVEYARKENLKVIPLCSYAKDVIEKDPSLQDVL